MKDFKATTGGFKLWFTQAVQDPEKLAEKISVRSFKFEYGYRYGSSEKDKKEHRILQVSGNGPFEILIDGLEAGRIFELEFSPKVLSIKGESIKEPRVQYTLNLSLIHI